MTIRQIEENLQKLNEDVGRLENLRQVLTENVTDLRKELGLSIPSMAEASPTQGQGPLGYRRQYDNSDPVSNPDTRAGRI